MCVNPFKPTAGKRPPVLIGRDAVIEDFKEGLENGAGAPGRLMMLSGGRGHGKSVLLGEFESEARAHGWKVVSDTAAYGIVSRLLASLDERAGSLDSLEVAPSFAKASISISDRAARSLRAAIDRQLERVPKGAGILLSIDEAQAASPEEMRALAIAYQHVIRDQDQTGLPDTEQRGLALVFAGLPSMLDDLLDDEVLTFLRRAQKRVLGSVPIPDTRDAYVEAIERAGKRIGENVARYAAERSFGHPYMIQLIGYYMWRAADRRGSQVVERADAEAGIEDALGEFYDAVDAPLYYNLRSPQRLFIEAMAQDAGRPSAMADIAKRCGRTQSWASKYRASLIRERVIEAAGYGLVRFTVPLLGEYIRERVLWHDEA